MYLHFNCFVPIYDVSTQCKGFDINYMYIAFVCTNIEPFTRNGKMKAGNSVGRRISSENCVCVLLLLIKDANRFCTMAKQDILDTGEISSRRVVGVMFKMR